LRLCIIIITGGDTINEKQHSKWRANLRSAYFTIKKDEMTWTSIMYGIEEVKYTYKISG
jgi:hypothetical protein